MVIHAWVQGWVAVCIAPARKASIPCKGSGRPRPGKLGCACVWRLIWQRRRRTRCCSPGAPILIALGRVHCTDTVCTAHACAPAAPMRCRAVSGSFDRSMNDFSEFHSSPLWNAYLAAQRVPPPPHHPPQASSVPPKWVGPPPPGPWVRLRGTAVPSPSTAESLARRRFCPLGQCSSRASCRLHSAVPPWPLRASACAVMVWM